MIARPSKSGAARYFIRGGVRYKVEKQRECEMAPGSRNQSMAWGAWRCNHVDFCPHGDHTTGLSWISDKFLGSAATLAGAIERFIPKTHRRAK